MGTGAILPISSAVSSPLSSIDYGSSSASASQQSVFTSLLNQLQQAAASGNLDQTATLLNAVESISPSSASTQSALGSFLTSLGSAVSDGSSSEVQSALAAYRSAVPASSTPSQPASSNSSATAAKIAAGLVKSQLQLSEVTTLLSAATGTAGTANSTASSGDNSQASLYSLLSAAFPQSGAAHSSSNSAVGSATDPTTNTAASPYETLVAALQANLAGSGSTSTIALNYLQSSGNFVNSVA